MATPAAKVSLQSRVQEPTYVFGADMSGDFSRGSAAVAARLYRADTDVGVGASGHAYAIPYRNSDGEMLSFGALSPHISTFLSHARAHPEEMFAVARFGCEAEASDDATMVRHFTHVPANCQLPGVWMRQIDPRMAVRLMVFDPFARFKDVYWQDKLKRYLSLNITSCSGAQIELVSVGAARSIVANDMAAKRLGLKHRVFGANEALFGKEAPWAAEVKAMWYSTHFLSLCDFRQTVQPQQFRATAEAIRAGLVVDQLEVEA